MEHPGRVTVVGSLNMDVVVSVERHPAPGETVMGRGHATHPGGKGANQAVAAARLGAGVRMVGRVGNDPDGAALLEALNGAGVDTSCVRTGDTPTGNALIQVDMQGQNTIVVSAGANAGLTVDDLGEAILETDVLVLQLEVPLLTVLEAAARARAAGALVVLNVAPAAKLSAADLTDVTHLVANEHEAATLLGVETASVTRAPLDAVKRLTELAPNALITLGADGAAWAVRDGVAGIQQAFPVETVDTTAAGDAFVGALAARLAGGETDMAAAVRFACAAGSLATTRAGAQPSLPVLLEVEALLGSAAAGQ